MIDHSPQLPLTGGCHCGAVRYQISALPKRTANCHCRTCQRTSGAAYLAIMFVATDILQITGTYQEYATPAASGNTLYRAFCPNCGCSLFARNSAFANIRPVTAATLDDPSWFKAKLDMWVAEAQAWDMMDPELPKFAGNPW
ncbi:MAG: GFA family protein [Methylococcaceae bacterium]|nr:GFA family protein [Methylococcaceae bacterium]